MDLTGFEFSVTNSCLYSFSTALSWYLFEEIIDRKIGCKALSPRYTRYLRVGIWTKFIIE